MINEIVPDGYAYLVYSFNLNLLHRNRIARVC